MGGKVGICRCAVSLFFSFFFGWLGRILVIDLIFNCFSLPFRPFLVCLYRAAVCFLCLSVFGASVLCAVITLRLVGLVLCFIIVFFFFFFFPLFLFKN